MFLPWSSKDLFRSVTSRHCEWVLCRPCLRSCTKQPSLFCWILCECCVDLNAQNGPVYFIRLMIILFPNLASRKLFLHQTKLSVLCSFGRGHFCSEWGDGVSVLLHPKEPHHHIAECGAQVLSRPHLSVKEASLLIFVVIVKYSSTCTLSSVHYP